jgi:peptide/nickel transport system ATP-binding protein
VARLVMRLIEPDRGTVRLGDTDLTRIDGKELRAQRRHIQMVFQDPFASLNPRRKVGHIITDGPIAHGADPTAARQRACDLLGLVGLNASAMERFPHEFSGGQRQRIGIARALALDPRILVADEAVSALDVSVQAQVLNLLEDLKARLGLSMLFITHDLRVAAQICDRIAVMQRGSIVELRSAAALFSAPEHPYTRELLAAVPGQTSPSKAA